MSLFTSSQFASSAASGTDWRDTSKTVLEKLESIRTEGHKFNLGFLYISDHLAEDAQSILNLFKSVLGIDHWVGGIGLGLCASGEALIDVPAISAMIGVFEPEDFKVFSGLSAQNTTEEHALAGWLKNKTPMLVCVHGTPLAEQDPALGIKKLEAITEGFLVGGLTSSRQQHAHFANNISENDMSGVAFSHSVSVATTLSQGCMILSPAMNVTRCDGHKIFEIDGEKAVNVFENCIRSSVIKKTDIDPNTILIDEAAMQDKNAVPEEFKKLFDAEIHAAIPVSGSDQNDYLVRNIIGLDPEEGSLSIAHPFMNGDRILFVSRDNQSVYKDLSARLVELRRRVEAQHGAFQPKGALYFSCVARAFSAFEGQSHNELQLIREIIGDVPLTGFYAGGEICKGRLYGYTGILTLFL